MRPNRNVRASSLIPHPSTFPRRRGVLLLLVLALLALFALIGLAFVLIATHAGRSARSLETINQTELGTDPAPKLINRAIRDFLRGENPPAAGSSPMSIVGAHSLLEDMYGNNPITGTIATIQGTIAGSPRTSTQLLKLTVTPLTFAQIAPRVGCVLTITPSTTLSSAAQAWVGQSTRIVAVDTAAADGSFWVMNSLPVPSGSSSNYIQDGVGAGVVINGVPYSGTGFGFAPIGGTIQEYSPKGQSLALQPNNPTNRTPESYGASANSDYTAPDFQHVFLAAQVANSAAAGGIQTLPSFQRSALVNYWINKTGSSSFDQLWQQNQTLCRAIMMRPIGQYAGTISNPQSLDHPQFTGSNVFGSGTNAGSAAFNPTWDGVTAGNGQWDVDATGNGVPDSVWVDLGAPVRSMNGRLCKPLFAVLCVDLDGRLNLNAHGSLAQADSGYGTFTDHTMTQVPAGEFAGGALPTNLSRGQGFGPAEISLNPVLTSSYYQQTLAGNGSLQGRYGSSGVPGTDASAGLMANKWFEYGQNYWDFTSVDNAGAYGSPPDPFGAGGIALDPAGRPLYMGMRNQSGNYLGFGAGTNSTPYESNLGPNISRGLPNITAPPKVNNPFSLAELERILRPFDKDASGLPSRLAALAPILLPPLSGTDPLNRLNVTTESWDVPCPNAVTPPSLTGAQLANLPAGRVTHFTDLLTARGIPPQIWPSLVPMDLLAGLKMNINRPFGNGRDYYSQAGDETNLTPNTTGVVDAPISASSAPPKETTLSNQPGITVNTDEIGGKNRLAPAPGPLGARQLEARYLYVLMCLTCDLNYLKTQFTALGSTQPQYDVARFLAQWAVNAVDFRSRDSIMTEFDYDPTFANPTATISSWNPPSPTAPTPGGPCTVFGCKRPELLISETLAFHDRRTQDTDQEVVDSTEGDSQTKPSKTTNPPPGTSADASFDQTYRPQGALFVELFNPSSPLEPQSTDFYDSSGAGVQLTKVTPPPSRGVPGSPVWRMLIAKPTVGKVANAEQPDPDDPDPTKRLPFEQKYAEREVYFVNSASAVLPAPLAGVTSSGQFTPSVASIKEMGGNVSVPPGRYALIGPADPSNSTLNGEKRLRTYIGFKAGATVPDSTTRFITLDPSDLASSPLPVQHNQNSQGDPATTNISPVIPLAIDYPRRLSVSEPVGGYDTATAADNRPFEFMGPPDPTTGAYTAGHIYDIPFDNPKRRNDGGQAFQQNTTVANYRVIYLQRLANPLLPYNPLPGEPGYNASLAVNPYRTVDMMAVDVTAFNGISTGTDPQDGGAQNTSTNIHFESRQRGENNDVVSGGLNANMNLWKQEPVPKTTWDTATDIPPGPLTTQNFSRRLKHSLGYLNQPFGPPQVNPATSEKGIPSRPFAWLTWNRRPYVSPMELLLVPVLRSSKLLTNAARNVADQNNYGRYFQIVSSNGAGAAPSLNPYTPPNFLPPDSVSPPLGLFSQAVPYPHLLNFFQSGLSNASPSTSPQFHRILEYLHVPSPFLGTETWANPTTSYATAPFMPPFNRISAYREPGRINLNTIYSSSVWAGLMAGLPDMAGTGFWQVFVQSRRADGKINVLDTPPASLPTEFAQPFRSFGGWSMTPAAIRSQITKEIDCTLLRSDPRPKYANRPLFQFDAQLPGTVGAYNDPNRNPYFRYQGLARLSNLVTTRSNVFAVWITVGYFEALPNHATGPGQSDAAHPEGYEWGQELGIDTGEQVRHRAFYIIDRTVPVAFQRGQDNNVEKAIVLSRYIE